MRAPGRSRQKSSQSRTASKRALFLLLIPLLASAGGQGFRSESLLDEQYSLHGREFGPISELEFLHDAQKLRDARGSHILQFRRPDRVTVKFEQRRGWYGTFNPDGTIRTFFMPPDGIEYFNRQKELYAGR